jgi:hypothetical protein
MIDGGRRSLDALLHPKNHDGMGRERIRRAPVEPFSHPPVIEGIEDDS